MLSFLTCAGIPTEPAWLVDEARILFGGHFFVQFFGVDEKTIHTTRVEHQRIVVAKKENCFQFWAFLFFFVEIFFGDIPIWSPNKPLHPGIPQTQWKSKLSGFPVKKMEGRSKLRQMLLGTFWNDFFPVKKKVHEFWVDVI